MKETNIYIKVRYSAGAYLASVYEPKINARASSTNSALVAVLCCAVKAALREPLRIEQAGENRYRCVFELKP